MRAGIQFSPQASQSRLQHTRPPVVPFTGVHRRCSSLSLNGRGGRGDRVLEVRRWQSTAAAGAEAQESPEEAYQRRLRESQRVEERVEVIYNEQEFREALDKAGHELVVLEVESTDMCQSGLGPEAELHWEEDKKASLSRCANLKHVFARTARDCPDVTFLTLEADTEEGQAACDALGVEVLPTVQFWRDGKKLWEHRGIVQLEQDLGEGVLFYGDSMANGVKASSFVGELKSKNDLETFVRSQPDTVLTVVNVSSSNATACVRVFAAIAALAKSFKGYAAFARLLYDTSDELKQLARDLRVVEVPTFIFYRGGKEVGRHVGASRADLIGQILMQQNSLGIAPPPPPVAAGTPRRRSTASSNA
ncbi:Thioredoxin-like protein CDSP32, chloroplastic [Coccomyxa sp. Obi]|nr:Thioredoxin-like protein CDSP32, chloroplastic [Coccomyxa sp. Obi]